MTGEGELEPQVSPRPKPGKTWRCRQLCLGEPGSPACAVRACCRLPSCSTGSSGKKRRGQTFPDGPRRAPPAQTAAACPWAGGTWSERSGLLLNRAPQRGRLLRKYLDWEKLLSWQRGEAKAMAKDRRSGAAFGPAVGPDLPGQTVAKGKALPCSLPLS